jgi:hypothetical protein
MKTSTAVAKIDQPKFNTFQFQMCKVHGNHVSSHYYWTTLLPSTITQLNLRYLLDSGNSRVGNKSQHRRMLDHRVSAEE